MDLVPEAKQESTDAPGASQEVADFFAAEKTGALTDTQIRRMVAILSGLGGSLQAAALCQLLDPPDFHLAFQILQAWPVIGADAGAAYFECIWEVPLLELLVYMHVQSGDAEGARSLVKLLQRPHVNAHNPKEARGPFVEQLRGRLLRNLSQELLIEQAPL